MPAEKPYISRPAAEAFLEAFATALSSPAKNPVVFHPWGMGGVGKSTLTRKLVEQHREAAQVSEVSFGLTEGIDEPIPLMAKLYGQIAERETWGGDPFWETYDLYFSTIHTLQNQSANGRGAVSETQVGQVKSLLKLGVDVAGELFLSESVKKAANTVVDRGMDAAVAGLSLKDDLMQLLQQHKATKRDQALQKLMLEPLPQLTQAFVKGLSQRTQQHPYILVLDTYEKAPLTIDTWLWRTLLGNTEIAQCPARLVVAGRQCLTRGEGWRKLQQDREVAYVQPLDRFDLAQTQAYLQEIGVTDEAAVRNIYRITKGLPYYLNWIRQQVGQGQPLDFDQGNQEISRLLLQGLNDTQKQVVQLAACCRSFDSAVIRYLAEQQQLDFATAVDESLNCFGWLTKQTFVEPMGKRWRLDDVARDVFRQSLEPADLAAIHALLAAYFKALSDQEVEPQSPPPARYEREEWRTLRAGYLYHLLFTRDRSLKTEFVVHLLEARCLQQDAVVKTPFTAVTAEFELDEHPLLRPSHREFLQQLRPAVLHGWAVLEETPIDYVYNEENYGLSQAETDQAIEQCLKQPDQFIGLARFAALFFKSKRCLTSQKLHWLQQAQTQGRFG